MLPNQLFFEWMCVGVKRKLIEICFYSSQTLSSDFRVQYCKMWQALIRSDIDGVKQSSEALGVGEMYGLLACILTARSWDVVTTGIDQGPVTDHEVCFRVLYVWVDFLVVINFDILYPAMQAYVWASESFFRETTSPRIFW